MCRIDSQSDFSLKASSAAKDYYESLKASDVAGGGFGSMRVRDDKDFQRHVDYNHYNPIKHGYVTRVVDWQFSSFHRFVQLGVYPSD